MEKNIFADFENLIFQSQMLTGLAYVLWDSLAKSESAENNDSRSLAAYFLYDQLEKFTAAFCDQVEKLEEKRSGGE